MGLLSELFRRRTGVVRSLNPAHPVLAFGKDAAWLTAGHEDCAYSCGRDTPFDKFRSLRGKVLFFDVPFNTFTFIHFLEDRVRTGTALSALPAGAATRRGRSTGDGQGTRGPDLACSAKKPCGRAGPPCWRTQLGRSGAIRRTRIGLSTLMLVTADDARALHGRAGAAEHVHLQESRQ